MNYTIDIKRYSLLIKLHITSRYNFKWEVKNVDAVQGRDFDMNVT